MAGKSATENEIFAINYAALAREIAMDILPLGQILELHRLSEEDWERIQANRQYQETIAGLVREWQSASNVRERVKIKAATGLESQLEVYVSEISDPNIPLAQRVEAGKFLARLGELDGARDVMGGAGGGGFSISINIGEIHKVVDVVPMKTIEAIPGIRTMIDWLMDWWRRYQRQTDVSILWPSCLEGAVDRHHAEMAFRLHMEMDPAYRDFSEAEKQAFVRELP